MEYKILKTVYLALSIDMKFNCTSRYKQKCIGTVCIKSSVNINATRVTELLARSSTVHLGINKSAMKHYLFKVR